MVVRNQTQVRIRIHANEPVGRGATARSSSVLGELQAGGRGRYTLPTTWRRISLSVEPVTIQQGQTSGSPARSPAVEIGSDDELQWEVTGVGGFYSVRLMTHYTPDAPP